MEGTAQRLAAILEHADNIGINSASLCNLQSVRFVLQSRSTSRSSGSIHFVAGFISVTLALIFTLGLNTSAGFTRTWFKWNQIDIHEEMVSEFRN